MFCYTYISLLEVVRGSYICFLWGGLYFGVYIWGLGVFVNLVIKFPCKHFQTLDAKFT